MGKCCPNLTATLSKRMTLQSLTRTADGQGGFTEAWGDEATVYGSIEPVKGFERYQAMQVQTPLSHTVMIRYRSGVTTAKRLKYGTRIFEIKEAVNVDEDDRILKLKVIETI